MKAFVYILAVLLVAGVTGCSKEVCPGMVKEKFSFDKKVRLHHGKRKPSPSLIHISRATAKTTRGR
jgi:hypothetical protein